jgi:hypothetical protein
MRRSILILTVVLGSGFAVVGWLSKVNASPAHRVTNLLQAPPSINLIFSQASSGVRVHRLGTGQALLDLGSVSHAAGPTQLGVTANSNPRELVLSTRFSLCIDQAGSVSSRTATVSAYVLYPDASSSSSIDGVRLSMSPQIIQRQARYGISYEHHLEVVIPVSAAEGDVSNQIEFLVTPD